MKVLQVNIFGNLSTGRIAVDLYRTLKQTGNDGIIAFARNEIEADVPHIRIGNKTDVIIHGVLSRITDRTGLYSKRATKDLIDRIREYNPDVIHLHNLHGYYINYKMLFEFLEDYKKPVVWTLHDCWAFTGHCCYYSMINCERWKTGCSSCPQKKSYPASMFLDNSKKNYELKQALFTKNISLTLVPVSEWLTKEVKNSFLRERNICTIYNGIDLNVFYPRKSRIRDKYHLGNRFMILSVASTWDKRKGLDDLMSLANCLDENYVVVVVGVSEEQKKNLPTSMVGIQRTNNIDELAELYSAADIYFNASVEETFGLTTVEAMACGTTVIVYDATALPEVVGEKCGYVVNAHEIETVKHIVEAYPKGYKNIYSIERAKIYEKQAQYQNYVELYNRIMNED